MTLTVDASGGTYGTTLTLTPSNMERLRWVSGNGLSFGSRNISKSEIVQLTAIYDAQSPSAAENDITLQATVEDRVNGGTITSCATTMVVRVELEAVYAAPENPCANRHVYGVGEEVKFKVSPKSASVMLRTTKRDSADGTGAYELFNGSEEIDAAEDRVYTCPISATYTPYIRVTLKGVEYSPSISLVEPQEVITPEASFDGVCWPSGACGEPGLRTVNYIGPMHVSFEGIAVSEVPCTTDDIIPPTGHFTNRTASLFHSSSNGAGNAIWIKPGNYWMIDNACSWGAESNWSAGTLFWKMPVGWHRKNYSGNGWHRVEGPDYEQCGTTGSRPLLIGGRKDLYMQKRTIQADGTFLNEKYGWWLTRTLNCRVRLGRDGETGRTVQWWH